MKNAIDMMASAECDDDIRTLTREMPEGVLTEERRARGTRAPTIANQPISLPKQ